MTAALEHTEGDLGVLASDSAAETPEVNSHSAQVGATSGALDEQEYAATWRMALLSADAGTLRGAQSDGGILGASDAGGCPHKAVLTVRRTPPTNVVEKGKALIGTALHRVFLEQMRDLNPALIVETELTATLPSGIEVLLHPDLLDPDEPSATDLKAVADLAYRQRVGVEDTHQMQRNLQGLAMIQAGLADPDSLIVRNIYLDMTDATNVWVQQEPFSMAWVEAADEWFQNVRYAVQHDEDGAKTGQPHFCARWCPFFALCKPPLLDAMGELQNPGLRDLAIVAREARDERKTWELVEKQAVERLRGVSGRVGDFQVVSTTVNSAKGGYVKVEFRDV